MTDEDIKLMFRIKSTQDGKDFIEYLVGLSHENYKQWKHVGGDVLRGKAVAFDELISMFDTIEKRVGSIDLKHNPEWM